MNDFILELNGSGIVIFDPANLEAFCNQHDITSDDIFDFFMSHPEVGDLAIKTGVVIPVYTIPALNYRIMIRQDEASAVNKQDMKFSYGGFPLQVTSGKIVVADIYAIMEWDAAYYKSVSTDKIDFPTQAAAVIAPGKYDIQINGFSNTAKNEKGYEFVFRSVDTFPAIDTEKDIDAYNYDLTNS
jgi:hypothetical protein